MVTGIGKATYCLRVSYLDHNLRLGSPILFVDGIKNTRSGTALRLNTAALVAGAELFS